jgi:hypothetical protein
MARKRRHKRKHHTSAKSSIAKTLKSLAKRVKKLG